MKITRYDLQLMFDRAKQNFINDSKEPLENQEFVAKCYLEAAIALLGLQINIEYPEVPRMESLDD